MAKTNTKTEEPFKVGDVVTLQSGGPPMTVQRRNTVAYHETPAPPNAECVWFDAQGLVHEKNFRLSVLKPAPAMSAHWKPHG